MQYFVIQFLISWHSNKITSHCDLGTRTQPEDGSDMFLWNNGNHLHDYMAHYDPENYYRQTNLCSGDSHNVNKTSF